MLDFLSEFIKKVVSRDFFEQFSRRKRGSMLLCFVDLCILLGRFSLFVFNLFSLCDSARIDFFFLLEFKLCPEMVLLLFGGGEGSCKRLIGLQCAYSVFVDTFCLFS